MNVLLTAVNAKYIHSNLAVYSLRAFAAPYRDRIEVAEFTINQQRDYMLQKIYEKKPDILAFSCYIWNIELILALAEEARQVLPQVKIWLGGPEVSFDGEGLLKRHPFLDGIMRGEGERSFLALMEYYLDGRGSLEQIPGLLFRLEDGEIGKSEKESPAPVDMDELPFPYGDLEDFSHRIVYYESSRGCPFSCSYCLSSIDRGVRLRSFGLVEKELQFFLDRRVPQVKFVDRTFNCNREHTWAVWSYLVEHDNGVTNFHFEIEGDLLRREELELLSRMRPGLVQLEIGVQSTNPKTLEAVNRRADFSKIAKTCGTLLEAGRQHLHLDLIAGLPWEDLDSFRQSFAMVYNLHPHELQLGFLKVLKGSGIREDAEKYGIVSRRRPVYEVLSTRWLSFDDILRLKGVEEMLEVYYNSAQFPETVAALEPLFSNPFDLYDGLAEEYRRRGLFDVSLSRLQRLEVLRGFARTVGNRPGWWYDGRLLTDWYLRENAKTRPSWAPDLGAYKKEAGEFYRREEQERMYLRDYEGYGWKQLMHMTHLEPVLDEGGKRRGWQLFDYRSRDPLTGNARVVEIE